jgi:sulfoxide reductase heme-binding subunit YedZ
MYPWIDYGGRVSPLRLAVFVSLFLPALWVMIALPAGWLGSRPVTEAIHQIGFWTIRFIFLALLVTPARRLLNWSKLIELRRMVGVAACCYVLFHFTLYAADEAFDLGTIASEVVLRIYLTIGFVALLGLVALAATSTDGMQRRLGARRWQRLHRIVYGIAVLAVIHFFMQAKSNVWEPLWMSGLLLWLMGWRLLDWRAPRGRGVPLWQVASLGIIATVATGFGEAGYYAIFNHVSLTRVLDTNFSLQIGVRPSWVVLGVSCAMLALGAIGSWRKLSGRASPARSRASAARGA